MPRGSPPLPPDDEAGSPSRRLPPWGWRTTTPAAVVGDRFVARTPCHRRPVRLARQTDEGVDVVVRCSYCARLWELHVAEVDGVGLSALWTA